MSCSGCPPKIARIATGFAYMAAGINEELSKQRLKICYNCPRLMGGMVCAICGCAVDAKTRLPEEVCPETKPGPRWIAQGEAIDIPHEEIKPKQIK